MWNQHFFLFCDQGKTSELEKIIQFDIFVVKLQKIKKISNSKFKKK